MAWNKTQSYNSQKTGPAKAESPQSSFIHFKDQSSLSFTFVHFKPLASSLYSSCMLSSFPIKHLLQYDSMIVHRILRCIQ